MLLDIEQTSNELIISYYNKEGKVSFKRYGVNQFQNWVVTKETDKYKVTADKCTSTTRTTKTGKCRLKWMNLRSFCYLNGWQWSVGLYRGKEEMLWKKAGKIHAWCITCQSFSEVFVVKERKLWIHFLGKTMRMWRVTSPLWTSSPVWSRMLLSVLRNAFKKLL